MVCTENYDRSRRSSARASACRPLPRRLEEARDHLGVTFGEVALAVDVEDQLGVRVDAPEEPSTPGTPADGVAVNEAVVLVEVHVAGMMPTALVPIN